MKHSAVLVICSVLLLTVACHRKESSSPPVATPTITLDKQKVALGSPLRITYKFVVAPGASIDGDYAVFVHVMSQEGEKMWQDDHAPAVPTSQWKPGQTVEYSRTGFVPSYPYVGDATIRLGLYNVATGKRLVLSGQEVSHQEYEVGRLSMLPESENVFLITKEGWHAAEVDQKDPLSQWRWTKKAATLAFSNPKRDATFYLDYDARTDLFNPPQQVTLKVARQTLATFAATETYRGLRTFPITAAQFGPDAMSEIVIELDRTFSLSSGDTRELGIRIYNAFVEPKAK